MPTPSKAQELDKRRERTRPSTMAGSLLDALRAEVAASKIISWPSPKYQRDPVGFARDILGIEVWSKQVEILESVRDHKRVAVRSGHKIGKSCCGAILALWFFASFDDARVVMTAPTARQVDEILFREIIRLLRGSKVLIDGDCGKLARTGLKAKDGREIVGFTAAESQGMAGISGANLLFLPDEASIIPDDIFEVIEGNTAAGGNCRVAMFSNPTRNMGVFFDAFHKKSAFWHGVHVSAEDTPNAKSGQDLIKGLAGRDFIETKRLDWGVESAMYKVRVLGEFAQHEESRIIAIQAIEESVARWELTIGRVRDEGYTIPGALQLGVDPAGPGVGGDESVFAVRRGQTVISLTAKRSLRAGDHIAEALHLIREHARPNEVATIVLDRGGDTGSKVFYAMRGYLNNTDPNAFRLVGVTASDKPSAKNFKIYGRVRDELWANLADFIANGGEVPKDSLLEGELSVPDWIGQNNGTMKATDKDEIRRILGRSCDRADAVALSVWESFAARADEYQPHETQTIQTIRQHGMGGLDPNHSLDWMRGSQHPTDWMRR